MKNYRKEAATGLLIVIPCLLFFAARDAASRRPKIVGRLPRFYIVLVFSPDGRYLAFCDWSDKMRTRIWDVQNRKVVREFTGEHVYWAPDSQRIALIKNAAYNPDRTADQFTELNWKAGIRFYDLKTQKLLAIGKDATSQTEANDEWQDATFSPDGKRFLVLTSRFCREFESATGKLMRRVRYGVEGKDNVLRRSLEMRSSYAALSPDGKYILQGIKAVQLFDAQSGKPLRRLWATSILSSGVGFSPDGRICWGSELNKSGNIHLWEARSGKLIRIWRPFIEGHLQFSPDSEHLIVVKPQNLELQEIRSGKTVQVLPRARTGFVRFAPDASFAISLDTKGNIWQWRLK